jgi:hypothetical protein
MRGVFFVCMIMTILVPLFSEPQWKLEHRNNVLSVYSRPVSYCRYREFRSVTEVSEPIEEVYRVFTDFHSYDTWFGYCKDSYTVKEHSDVEKTVFLLIDTPWPIIDKYLLPDVTLDTSFENGRAYIHFELTEGSYHIRPGEYEPVEKIFGDCVLEELSSGGTKVTFTCAMDPGGDIPVLFIEKFQLDQMIETAVNLHGRLKLLLDFSPAVPKADGLVKYGMPRR